ncbi:MAG TPA: hypothetical protein VLT36_14710, partial [Candidatus Dormibacteraeota bacterium]|nr:hypothetical protein [Candidatus Dormibacteraeota bacterium]
MKMENLKYRRNMCFLAVGSGLLILGAVSVSATTEEAFHKRFIVHPEGSLVVDVDCGGIEVGTNGTGDVIIEVKRKVGRKTKADEEKYLREHPIEFLQDGDKITVRCREKSGNGMWSWRGTTLNEADYTITLPAHFNAKLNTAGGSIVVNDLTGKVKADTSGGGLRFTRIHGQLNGATSGGSIRMSECDGEQRIRTSGGGIEVSGGAGSLDGATSGGSVKVENFHGPARVETSGGGIAVQNVAGKIDGQTSGGSIHAVLVSPLADSVRLSTSGGGITVRIPGDAA